MRHNGGWYKSHRDDWESDLSQNHYLWAIWNALQQMATWKETQFLWKGKARVIPPGSVIMGIKELADRLKCDQKTVSRWLKYLRETKRISLETSTRGTLVILCQWLERQNDECDKSEPSPNEVRTKSDQGPNEVRLSEEGKKEELRIDQTNAQMVLSETSHPDQNCQPLQPSTVNPSNVIQFETRSQKQTGTKASRRNQYPAEFEEVYKAYPRHQGKKKGFAVYQRQIKTEQDRAELIAAIERYKQKNIQTEDSYLKHFDTFMREWEDWLLEDTGTFANGRTKSLTVLKIEDL